MATAHNPIFGCIALVSLSTAHHKCPAGVLVHLRKAACTADHIPAMHGSLISQEVQLAIKGAWRAAMPDILAGWAMLLKGNFLHTMHISLCTYMYFGTSL